MITKNTSQIKTNRLILRKFTTNDVVALFEIMSDVKTNKFLPWFPIKNIEEAKQFLKERFLDDEKQTPSYRYAICLKEDDKPIGYVCLANAKSNDFGYGLRSGFWHKGIVSEAAKAVVEQIKEAGYPYITATHDINNPRSGEVMKSLGMKYQYSYEERWQPKDLLVTFRMYQLNFRENDEEMYMEYWDKYKEHFAEVNI